MTLYFGANSWARPPRWWLQPPMQPQSQHLGYGSRHRKEQEPILFFHPCDLITAKPRDSSIHILTQCRREMFSFSCPPRSRAFPTILHGTRIEKVQVSHSTMVPFLEVKMPLLLNVLSPCSTGFKVGASQPGKLGQQNLLEKSSISKKLFHI